MNEYLNCRMCHSSSEKSYECVSCGHLHCFSCLKNSSNCRVCNKPSTFKISKLAIRLIGNEAVPCQFCGIIIKKKELKEHKYDCHNWVFFCSQNKCTFKGTKADLLAHIRSAHENLIYTYFTSKMSSYIDSSSIISNKRPNTAVEGRSMSKSVVINKEDFPSLEDISDSKSKRGSDSTTKKDKDCIVF